MPNGKRISHEGRKLIGFIFSHINICFIEDIGRLSLEQFDSRSFPLRNDTTLTEIVLNHRQKLCEI